MEKVFTCSSCLKKFAVPERQTQFLLGIDSPKLELAGKIVNNDYQCEICQKRTVSLVENVTYLPNYFFVFIQRRDYYGQMI